jgi:ppGpp synthetase/RelA/SpoT-type nucleotidyltranferase
MSEAEIGKDGWPAKYASRRPFFEAYTEDLAVTLTKLLAVEGIDHAQLEKRTKTIESFTEKIARKDGKYGDPTAEITDLSGLRVIVYYLEDVDRVGELLRREFRIDEENTRDTMQDLAPDRFAYTSVHYVISLDEKREAISEWQPFLGMRAEVQVRTVLQHAWAAIDHKLRYKRPSAVPANIRRDLFRLSALLELADKEFLGVRRAAEEIQAQYTEAVSQGNFDLAVDRESLVSYLAATGKDARWSRVAVEQGFVGADYAIFDEDDHDEDDDSGYADDADSMREWDLQFLLDVLDRAEIRSIDDLDRLLNAAEDWGPASLAEVARLHISHVQLVNDGSPRHPRRPGAWPIDVISILVVLARSLSLDGLGHFASPLDRAIEDVVASQSVPHYPQT